MVRRRPEPALDRRQGKSAEAERLQPAAAFPLQDVPADLIPRSDARDVRRRRVQRKVRRGECEVMEERAIGKFLRMVTQARDGVIGHGRRDVEAGRLRQRRAVDRDPRRFEEIVLPADFKAAVEAVGERLAVHVPLAGVIRPIARGAQPFRQEFRPGLARATITTRHARDHIAPHLLGIVAGEHGRARGPTTRGVIELGEAYAAMREGVELRSADFAAIGADVREPEVVRENEDNIGLPRRRGRGRHDAGRDREQETGDKRSE